MKELNYSEKLNQAKTEQEIKKQQEYRLIGRWNKIPGLKLFELNTDSLTFREINPETIGEIGIDGATVTRNKVQFNPEYLYIQAHCYRTAVRKVNKILKGLMGVEQFFDENAKR